LYHPSGAGKITFLRSLEERTPKEPACVAPARTTEQDAAVLQAPAPQPSVLDTPAMSAEQLTIRLEKATTAAELCWNRVYVKDMNCIHLTCGAKLTTSTLNPHP